MLLGCVLEVVRESGTMVDWNQADLMQQYAFDIAGESSSKLIFKFLELKFCKKMFGNLVRSRPLLATLLN